MGSSDSLRGAQQLAAPQGGPSEWFPMLYLLTTFHRGSVGSNSAGAPGAAGGPWPSGAGAARGRGGSRCAAGADLFHRAIPEYVKLRASGRPVQAQCRRG
eukprot:2888145-Pyramimonas_sp.AAC.1